MDDPMSVTHPMDGSEPAAPPVAVWDARLAREALEAAQAAAGPARHSLLAQLALRLDQLGLVTDLRFSFVDCTESFEALRAAFEEMAGAAPEADARLSAYEPAGDEQRDLGSAPCTGAAHASAKRSGPLARRTRACLVCGAAFEVNFRHAEAHRFCSAVCRSRHCRAQRRQQVRAPQRGLG